MPKTFEMFLNLQFMRMQKFRLNILFMYVLYIKFSSQMYFVHKGKN